jgi:endonuclease/exonuclease/phosphatase family metal-dependent hydrolase
LSRIKKFALAGACAASVLATVPAVAPAQKKTRDVKVMVRNLYLGADIIKLAATRTREEMEQQASVMYQTIQNNNFAVRAKAIAREIDRVNPHVIGLQEVSLFRKTPDGQQTDGELNATEVVIDHLALLRQELNSRGLNYRVVKVVPNTDLEAPLSEGFELRLTNRDVVLAKRSVKIDKRLGAEYENRFTVPLPTGPVEVTRGWAGADLRVRGAKFRFVTAHAEAYSPQNAEAQLQEILDGPLKNKRRQSIMVGDFNSDPDEVSDDEREAERTPSGYLAVTEAGFKNAIRNPIVGDERQFNTCCQAEDLREASGYNLPLFDEWIDHIMVRPKVRTAKQGFVGNRPSDIFQGLWPSDHAGVWAKLRLKR